MTFIWRGSHIKAFSGGGFYSDVLKRYKKIDADYNSSRHSLLSSFQWHVNKFSFTFQLILENKNAGTEEMREIIEDWRRREAAWLSARSGFLWKEDPGVAAFLFCFSWPSRLSTWAYDRLCHQQHPQNVNGRQNWRWNWLIMREFHPL